MKKQLEAPTKLIILGVTDEETTCWLCGKKNLKKTIALAKECGEVVYYGSECAAKSVSFGMKSSNVKFSVKVTEHIQLKNATENTFKQLREFVWLYCGTQVGLENGQLVALWNNDTKQYGISIPAKTIA